VKRDPAPPAGGTQPAQEVHSRGQTP
jgi:hypothetical protein